MENSLHRLIEISDVKEVSLEELQDSRDKINSTMEKFKEEDKEETFPQNIILGGCH